MKKLKILIIEPSNITVAESTINGKELLKQGLAGNAQFDIETINQVPDSIFNYDVIILNNLNDKFPAFKEERIIEYVESGGGLLCIHDTVSPQYGYKKISVLVGIQEAYDTYTYERDGNIVKKTQWLAIPERNNPAQLIPIKIVNDNDTHPILENVNEFEL